MVEVAPSYDHGQFDFAVASVSNMYMLMLIHTQIAEITGIAAADLVHDFLSMMLIGKQEAPLSSPVDKKAASTSDTDGTVYRDEL